jgi:hypothetical protein
MTVVRQRHTSGTPACHTCATTPTTSGSCKKTSALMTKPIKTAYAHKARNYKKPFRIIQMPNASHKICKKSRKAEKNKEKRYLVFLNHRLLINSVQVHLWLHFPQISAFLFHLPFLFSFFFFFFVSKTTFTTISRTSITRPKTRVMQKMTVNNAETDVRTTTKLFQSNQREKKKKKKEKTEARMDQLSIPAKFSHLPVHNK